MSRSAALPIPLTLLVARAAGLISRLLGRGRGTSIPGYVAAHLNPRILQRLAADLRDGVVVVTGTNGKTTTCHLLRTALSTTGLRVVANASGSNLEQGVVTALIRARDLRGRPTATLGVFEVDEAAFASLAMQLDPRLVVVLNVFRDQLDRHAELDRVAQGIGAGLAHVHGDVILAADDAVVAALPTPHARSVTYFGLDRPVQASEPSLPATPDLSPCPRCGERLYYGWVAYAQLGDYGCVSCGLRRPPTSVAVTAARQGEGAGWRVWLRSGPDHVSAKTALRGVYNVYNLLAAVAAAGALGVPAREALEAVASAEAVPGRGAPTSVGFGEIVILLGKNPTGVAQVLQAYVCPEPAAPLLLVLNDAAPDGRDVSWIWDAPMEALTGRPAPVLVTGTRAQSMITRLRYAEVPALARSSLDQALEDLAILVRRGGRAFVLTTYSGVGPLDDRLARLTQRERGAGSRA